MKSPMTLKDTTKVLFEKKVKVISAATVFNQFGLRMGQQSIFY
jgi:hypothetical protein